MATPIAHAAVRAAPSKAESGAKVAILPLVVEGDLSDADRDALTAELVDGLRRGDFEVIEPSVVVERSSDAASCSKQKCLQAIAEDMGATHVLRARVTVEDRDYDVDVELFDGSSGSSLAKTSEGCEICGIADAGNLMETAAATLRTKLDALAKGPSTLALTSNPAGAEVRLDGEIIGVTPLKRPVVPGKRVVRVSKEGYIAVEREVTFVEGVAEKVSFDLDKVPSRLPSRPWGWVSLSLGVVAIGGAVAFAAVGGRENPPALTRLGSDECVGRVDMNGNCEFVWNTEWHALGFGLAGGALTTLGIAVLLNSRARRGDGSDKSKKKRGKKQARRPRPRMGVGVGSVTLQGRF